MHTRPFLKALFDHDFGRLLAIDELSAFSEWLKETMLTSPGLLVAFPLGDGNLAYAHA